LKQIYQLILMFELIKKKGFGGFDVDGKGKERSDGKDKKMNAWGDTYERLMFRLLYSFLFPLND
jgi:hypothetical protein